MAQIQVSVRFMIKEGPYSFSNYYIVSKIKKRKLVIISLFLCIMTGWFDDMIIVFRGINSDQSDSNNLDF